MTRKEQETGIILDHEYLTVWTTIPRDWRRLQRFKSYALSWNPEYDSLAKEVGGEARFPAGMFHWPLSFPRKKLSGEALEQAKTRARNALNARKTSMEVKKTQPET